jgi:hypothetical protein
VRLAARRAEDAGNFAGARRLLRLLPADAGVRRWTRSLDEVLALGSNPEPALLAGWLVQPALRYGHELPQAGAVTALADEVLRTWGRSAAERAEQVSDRIIDDPLVADAGLFDEGILAAYLYCRVAPSLLARAFPVHCYPGAAIAAFETLEVRPTGMRLRSLLDGRQTWVEPVPAAESGRLLYGRLVPGVRGSRFALPPVPVDRVTARRVIRAVARHAPVQERLRAVASYQRRCSRSDPP